MNADTLVKRRTKAQRDENIQILADIYIYIYIKQNRFHDPLKRKILSIQGASLFSFKYIFLKDN